MVATNYAWNPVFDCVTKETNDAGSTIARYTHEPKHYGGLISQHRSGATSIYHYDAIGTTRALTDSNQNVTDTAVYTAFGEKTSSVGTTANPYGFLGLIGCYSETSARIVSVRRRGYLATLARWSAKDPLLLEQTMGPYIYCSNRPLVSTDPSGMQEKPKNKLVETLKCAEPSNEGCNCFGSECKFSIEVILSGSNLPSQLCFIHSPGEFPEPVSPPRPGQRPPAPIKKVEPRACTSEINRALGETDYFEFTLRSGTKCRVGAGNMPPNEPWPPRDLSDECRRALIEPTPIAPPEDWPDPNPGYRTGMCFGFLAPDVVHLTVDFRMEISCGCDLYRATGELPFKGEFGI
jgi:RHS repeat-associated protein